MRFDTLAISVTFQAPIKRLSLSVTMLIALGALSACEHSGPKPDTSESVEKALPSESELCRLVFRRAMNLSLNETLQAFAQEGMASKSELPEDSSYRRLARCAATLSDCDTLPANIHDDYAQALRAISQDQATPNDSCDPLLYRRAKANHSLGDFETLLAKHPDCEQCFFERSVLKSQKNIVLDDDELTRALAFQRHPAFLREHAIRRARQGDAQTAALYEEYLALLPSDAAQEKERTHLALASVYREQDDEKYRTHLDAAFALRPHIDVARAQLGAAQSEDERFILSQRLASFKKASTKERSSFAELAFARGDALAAITTLDDVLDDQTLEAELRESITQKRGDYIAQTEGVREHPYRGTVTEIAKVMRKDIEPMVLALKPKGNQLTRARIDIVVELDASGTLTALSLAQDTLGEESIARAIRINLGRAQMRSPGGTHRFALEFIYGKP